MLYVKIPLEQRQTTFQRGRVPSSRTCCPCCLSSSAAMGKQRFAEPQEGQDWSYFGPRSRPFQRVSHGESITKASFSDCRNSAPANHSFRGRNAEKVTFSRHKRWKLCETCEWGKPQTVQWCAEGQMLPVLGHSHQRGLWQETLLPALAHGPGLQNSYSFNSGSVFSRCHLSDVLVEAPRCHAELLQWPARTHCSWSTVS